MDGAVAMIRDYASQSKHSCSILTDKGGYNHHGIEVYTDDNNYLDHYNKADVVITHLGKTGKALNSCRKVNKPLIFISHNTTKYGAIQTHKNVGVIYNAHWTKEKLPYQNDSVVCHPMCVYPDLPEGEGDHVTLVNCNENKGVRTLRAIAKSGIKCLGVKGYGIQIKGKYELLEQDENIYNILSRTKVLIMPSKKESWGRIGAEALCMGIPVIAHENEGIKECLADSAWYIDRSDYKGYINAINRISGEMARKYFKGQMKKRLTFLKDQAKDDIRNFDNFITKQQKTWLNVRQYATL